jgi:hypothetical protein
MEWVLEHIQLLILVGGAIAYWINQRRGKTEEGEPTSSPYERTAPTASGPGEDERVRRIQEEIRRRIMERTAGGGRPDVPEAAPPQLPPLQPRAERMDTHDGEEEEQPARPAPQRRAVAMDAFDAAETERQHRLAEQLRELQQRQAETKTRVDQLKRQSSAAERQTQDQRALAPLNADLRDPAALRRAVILQEVLGKPVSLR